VLESWLDKSNERSFQIPFCHSLAADGYEVVHMSRHCAMEMGKDIIAFAPDGVPCAYQLKGVDGGKLTLGKWRDDLQRQVYPLVYGKLVHPSVNTDVPHRTYIVINGELDEEVAREIDDFNRTITDRPKLETIVRGTLLTKFKALQQEFWPLASKDYRTFLQLFFEPGDGPLPKAKFAELLALVLPVEPGASSSATNASRWISGAGVLCSTAISQFTERENHGAEFEAWTIYLSYLLAVAERFSLPPSEWKAEAEVAVLSMFTALGRLCDELRSSPHLVIGDPFVDRVVYRARITHLVGLMSLYGLWRRSRNVPTDDDDQFIRRFIAANAPKLHLWGEAAIPQFVAHFFFQRSVDARIANDFLLAQLINNICRANAPQSTIALPNPYYDAEAAIPHVAQMPDEQIKESFAGAAFTLEPLVQLFAACNLKNTMRQLWPAISRVSTFRFVPEEPWQFHLWRSPKGLNVTELRPPSQSWSALRQLAASPPGDDLPHLVRRFPVELLAMTVVMPHRFTSSVARFLDGALRA
jgi:hypothetical protein